MKVRAGLAGLAIAVTCGLLLPSAEAATFTSGNQQVISAQPGFPASPYPSTISVSGLSGHITDLDVTVDHIFAPEGDGLAMLLQGPGGESLVLLDGGPSQIISSGLTFDDSASGQVPVDADLSSTGAGRFSFKPTDYYADDDFPLPGPGTSYANPGPDGGGSATLASTFNGTDPNGNWKLFVVNFGSTNDANTGPWSIQLSGFEGFTLGKPTVTRNLKRVTLPVTFAGPGRALVDDATHPFYRAAKKRQKPRLKPPGTLITPEANFFINSAGTYDLPVLPSSKAKRILARRGRVTLPVRVTFGTIGPNQQNSKSFNITLRKRPPKRQ
jgi:hypothetical protein